MYEVKTKSGEVVALFRYELEAKQFMAWNKRCYDGTCTPVETVNPQEKKEPADKK
jgi:hypothetical protein